MNNISTNSELKSRIDAIPDKMGFKIGEVAEFVGVKQYVLRYWETEFENLHPRKSQNGQRFYTRKDIETALMIRKLLHEDRFSIEGARAVLKKMKHHKVAANSQISPILEGTTEAQVVEANQPATEVVLNKATAQASVVQVEKAVHQRERELNQYWSSSLDYLIEEIRQARRRILE